MSVETRSWEWNNSYAHTAQYTQHNTYMYSPIISWICNDLFLVFQHKNSFIFSKIQLQKNTNISWTISKQNWKNFDVQIKFGVMYMCGATGQKPKLKPKPETQNPHRQIEKQNRSKTKSKQRSANYSEKVCHVCPGKFVGCYSN